MGKNTFTEQLKNNLVALISLVVAIIALSYTTWREELTEKNRNTRLAAFEMLKNLGELQIVINYSHYAPESQQGNPLLGWGYIAMIGDLSKLLPHPIPETADRLLEAWEADWQTIKTSQSSVDKISQEIDLSRQKVLGELYNLK